MMPANLNEAVGVNGRAAAERASDETLAARAAEGCPAAGEELVRRWCGPVFGYCRRRLRAPLEPEDVTQQIFIAMFRRLPGRRQAGPFAPWLFAVARSVVTDAIRSASRRPPSAPTTAPEGADVWTPARAAMAGEAEADLWRRAKDVLTKRQFTALELRVGKGLDVASIAAAMGLTATHVKVLLFRARRALLAAGADRALKAPAAEPGLAAVSANCMGDQ